MFDDPSTITPADDSGRKTFERYCYQAHIAFPFCLDCALNGEVLCVVAEHIEDIAVQFRDGWRFLQIKTRDAERGPWKLADLVGKAGALHSLLRSHRILNNVGATLEMFLEGALAPRDPINKMLSSECYKDAELSEKIRVALRLDAEECESFLRRVRLVPSRPTRESIYAHNYMLLSSQGPHLSGEVITQIYDRFLGIIYNAMQAKALPLKWRSTILSDGCLRGKSNQLFLQKKLTAEHFKSIVTPLTTPRQPLLKRILNTNLSTPTLLEQKLIIGGASPELIFQAKTLRALATAREIELKSSGLYDDGIIEDVQNRLLTRTLGLIDEHRAGGTPAASIWNKLVWILGEQREIIDSRRLFHQDPDLLLGEICNLSDLCKTNWGIAGA